MILWSIEIHRRFYRNRNEINTVMGLWVTERLRNHSGAERVVEIAKIF